MSDTGVKSWRCRQILFIPVAVFLIAGGGLLATAVAERWSAETIGLALLAAAAAFLWCLPLAILWFVNGSLELSDEGLSYRSWRCTTVKLPWEAVRELSVTDGRDRYGKWLPKRAELGCLDGYGVPPQAWLQIDVFDGSAERIVTQMRERLGCPSTPTSVEFKPSERFCRQRLRTWAVPGIPDGMAATATKGPSIG
jgi:hypothetical protein